MATGFLRTRSGGLVRADLVVVIGASEFLHEDGSPLASGVILEGQGRDPFLLDPDDRMSVQHVAACVAEARSGD